MSHLKLFVSHLNSRVDALILEILSKTLSTNQKFFCAWALRLVPSNNMVVMINPMRILVRLVLNYEEFQDSAPPYLQ